MSNAFEMKKEDWFKVVKGLFIAGAGAGATYLEQTIPMITFGEYTPIIVAVNCVIVNLIRKWMTGKK